MSRQIAPAAAQPNSRYSTAADALAALVDAAASAPQMDVAKSKEANKHDAGGPRDDEINVTRPMQLPINKAPITAYSDGGAGSGGGKEKIQPTKSRIEEELRQHGKTTITAASFIDVIITRQIASEKDSRERGSQSSDSTASGKKNVCSVTIQ